MACKPLPWSYGGGAQSSSEYARILLKNAEAIVVARVVSAESIPFSGDGTYSKAEVRVIERFKGADDIRRIHSKGWGTCPTYRYAEGEERLFVLSPPSDGELYEVSYWQHPQFPMQELLGEFRKQTQPNRTVERDARKSGARPSP